MEVACGEHGEYVHKLVSSVNSGKCKAYRTNNSPKPSPSLDLTHHQKTVNGKDIKEIAGLESNGTIEGAPAGNGMTVLNLPASCTTSLLDSAESIEQTFGFPTNGWMQFWILLKRTFLSQMRDMVSVARRRMLSYLSYDFVDDILIIRLLIIY